MERYYIGLDIGGTKCAACVACVSEGNMTVLRRTEVKTTHSPNDTLALLFPAIDEYAKSYKIEKIGVSCGGPLDSKTGVILTPPNLTGWHHFPIVEFLQSRFSLPASLENDANACALAEWQFGAGRGATNMIFLTFGTGLGAGLILDGKLYSGTNGNAGEVGHIRLASKGPTGYGKAGSFEGFCSGGGIARLAQIEAKRKERLPESVVRMGGIDAITTKKLSEEARAGDAFAKSIFDKSGKMLGKGLAVLVDVFNPEKIVLGGVFMRSGDLLIPAMRKTLEKESLACSLAVCEILPARLYEGVGDYAAVSVATR